MSTYNSGLKDEKVSIHTIYQWQTATRQYTGTYEGALGSGMKLQIASKGTLLQGTLNYSIDVVTPEGMVETKNGKTQITIQPTQRKISTTTHDINVQSAEFVQWDNGKGILLKLKNERNELFVLLKKTH